MATETALPLKQLELIIACLNDAPHLDRLLSALPVNSFKQVSVADGGSTDHTSAIAQKHAVTLVHCPEKGRAQQFNFTAAQSTAPYLLFLHADSLLGNNFLKALEAAIDRNIQVASFRLQFDHKHRFLQACAWCTRFNTPFLRFGDQGLLIARNMFRAINGYAPKLLLMEDQEIFWRLKKHTKAQVLPAVLITSSRKYLKNGVYRLQAIFFVVWFRYYLGTPQQQLWDFYNRYVYQESKNTPEYDKKESSAAHFY